MENRNFLTVRQFNEQYPNFKESALRALIFNSHTNGFEKVIIRFSPTGKRGKILLDVTAFFEWLQEQNREILS